MKTFTDIKSFERRIQNGPNWNDYFTLGGRMYKIYEYGPGIGVQSRPDYVYFVNKRTRDAIKVEYDCPSADWKKIPEVCEEDGKKHHFVKGGYAYGNMNYCTKCLRREREQVTTRRYALHSVETIPAMDLWRTDTL